MCYLELVYRKEIILNSQKYFLRLFKMAADQVECFRLKQRSVIKFLLVEKSKPYEIYRKICDVHREECFSQKMFANRLNMGLSLSAWIKKTVHGVETHWLSSKEKVPDAAVTKDSDVDSLLGQKRTHHYWFLWKRCNHKQYFLLPIP